MTREMQVAAVVTLIYVVVLLFTILRPRLNPVRMVIGLVRLGIGAVVITFLWIHALAH